MPRMILATLLALVSGCAFGVRDNSMEPAFESLRSKRHVLVRDSFVFQAYVHDLSSAGFGRRTLGPAVQVFGLEGEPRSWVEYTADRARWDRELFVKGLPDSPQRTALGPLPRGTTLRITKVVDYPHGSEGHEPAVQAEILSGRFRGSLVTIPTGHWLTTPPQKNYPEWMRERIWINIRFDPPGAWVNPRLLRPEA